MGKPVGDGLVRVPGDVQVVLLQVAGRDTEAEGVAQVPPLVVQCGSPAMLELLLESLVLLLECLDDSLLVGKLASKLLDLGSGLGLGGPGLSLAEVGFFFVSLVPSRDLACFVIGAGGRQTVQQVSEILLRLDQVLLEQAAEGDSSFSRVAEPRPQFLGAEAEAALMELGGVALRAGGLHASEVLMGEVKECLGDSGMGRSRLR